MGLGEQGISREVLSLSSYALFVLLLVSLVACGDYRIQLGGGYELVRLDTETFCFDHDHLDSLLDNNLSDANILMYANTNNLIIGQSECVDQSPTCNRDGFFLIEKTRRTGLWGLSSEEWTSVLKDHGFDEPPILHRPTRLDTLLPI